MLKTISRANEGGRKSREVALVYFLFSPSSFLCISARRRGLKPEKFALDQLTLYLN